MADIKFSENKSIEELTREVWHDPKPATDLIDKVYRFRKIPVGDLTIEQLRLLMNQKEALKYLIPVAINKLKINILSEGDLYEGDLLLSVLSIDENFWHDNQSMKKELLQIIDDKGKEIEDKNQDNLFRQLLRKIEVFRNDIG